MVSITDIQKDLPRWPEDVIEQWLLYFANEPECGWPPPEPLGDHRWGRLLGGRPLSWWKDVTWKKQKVRCDLAGWTQKAQADVTEIVAQMTMPFSQERWSLQESQTASALLMAPTGWPHST